MAHRTPGNQRRIQDLIRVIDTESRKVLPDRGLLNITLDNLSIDSKRYGLQLHDFGVLTESLQRKSLNAPCKTRILKCLVPAQAVPVEAVLNCLSWINTQDVPEMIKDFVLRWIVAIYDYIDDHETFHIYYASVFQYVKYEKLRPVAVTLLILMTRFEDVLTFRVERIVRRRELVGYDPYLDSLLATYKCYRPQLVPFTLPAAAKKLPDSYLRPWLTAVQELHAQNLHSRTFSMAQNAIQFWKHSDGLDPVLVAKSRKRCKLLKYLPNILDQIGPLIYTGEIDESDRLSVHSCGSKQELFSKLDIAEISSLPLTILRYPIVQSFASIRRWESFASHFDDCLKMVLFYEFAYHPESTTLNEKRSFLESVLRFSEYLQEGIPAVKDFLMVYLQSVWGGEHFCDIWLKFIARQSPTSSEELSTILTLIKRHYLSANVSRKAQFIGRLTRFLRNLLTVELKRQIPADDASDSPDYGYFFHENQSHHEPVECIVTVTKFVHHLCSFGLLMETDNHPLLHSAISFYTLVADIPKSYKVPYIELPSPSLVYLSFFSTDPFLVSRICSLLCGYKGSLDLLGRLSPDRRRLIQNFPKLVEQFHSYVIDLTNFLWRNRAFLVHGNSRFVEKFTKELMQSVEIPNTNTAFNVFEHPAFLGMTIAYNEKVSPIASSAFATSLDKPAATAYIHHLYDSGFRGFYEFILTFVNTQKPSSSSSTSG